MYQSSKSFIQKKPLEVEVLPGDPPKRKKKKTNKDFFEGASPQPPIKTKPKK
tara:strand:- start:708 stop:863 length:156 start_codon:yes stop_codon:yes gene_type:complete